MSMENFHQKNNFEDAQQALLLKQIAEEKQKAVQRTYTNVDVVESALAKSNFMMPEDVILDQLTDVELAKFIEKQKEDVN